MKHIISVLYTFQFEIIHMWKRISAERLLHCEAQTEAGWCEMVGMSGTIW